MTQKRLAPGDSAPEFTLPTATGDALSLKDLRGHTVIMYAYPRAMTPGCTTQACDFRDNLSTLEQEGYRVLGISPDTPERLTEFAERDHLTYTLLSDPDHTVLEEYGAWGEKQNYGRTSTGVIRSTFVIDPEGVIQNALYNVKATGHVARLIRELNLQ